MSKQTPRPEGLGEEKPQWAFRFWVWYVCMVCMYVCIRRIRGYEVFEEFVVIRYSRNS